MSLRIAKPKIACLDESTSDSAPESHGTHTEELGTESKARLKAQIDVGGANNSAKDASDENSPGKDQMKPRTPGDGGQT